MNHNFRNGGGGPVPSMRSHPIHTRGKVWNFGRETARVQWSEATARTVPPSGGRWPLGREPKGGGTRAQCSVQTGAGQGRRQVCPLGPPCPRHSWNFPCLWPGSRGKARAGGGRTLSTPQKLRDHRRFDPLSLSLPAEDACCPPGGQGGEAGVTSSAVSSPGNVETRLPRMETDGNAPDGPSSQGGGPNTVTYEFSRKEAPRADAWRCGACRARLGAREGEFGPGRRRPSATSAGLRFGCLPRVLKGKAVL